MKEPLRSTDRLPGRGHDPQGEDIKKGEVLLQGNHLGAP